MIEESAVVVKVEGSYAWVERERQSSCGSCAANKGCGTATLQKVMGNKRSQLKALNRAQAKEGDCVVIGLQEQALLKGSLYAYLMPLLVMLLGAVIAEGMFANEGLTILGGLAGLLSGFFLLKRFSERVAEDVRFQAVVLRSDGNPQSDFISFHN